VPDRNHPKRVCRSVCHRNREQVKPDKDWVPLREPPTLMGTIEASLAYDKLKVDWCLLCDSPIESEADFIPETNTNNCAEGLRFHEGCKDPHRKGR
jgi:hypothetical protein